MHAWIIRVGITVPTLQKLEKKPCQREIMDQVKDYIKYLEQANEEMKEAIVEVQSARRRTEEIKREEKQDKLE